MTKKTIFLIAFIILKFVLQYSLVSPEYELQRDEYLHLDQANHLAWGYVSVPPVTSWISVLIQLLGSTIFWVRFFPALFGALTIAVVWKTIEALKGNLFALVLGAAGVLLSAILRLNVLYQPNSLDLLCWAAFYFIVIKYINTQKTGWLYAGALIFVLGFLNKYNFIFLLAGLLPAVLLSVQRRIFTKKEFYVALAAALLLILPNLVWQYQNNFPVVHHMKELNDTQLININRFNFLKEQLLFFAGSILVLVAGVYALLFYPPFKQYRFFVWVMIFTLALFTYLKAKSYYAMGLYPVYIAFGAVYVEEILKAGWKKYLRPVLIAVPVVAFIPMYFFVFPNKSPEHITKNPSGYKKLGLLRWEDGKDHAIPQDFADMVGWKELAEKTDSIFNSLPDVDHSLLLCDNYGQAGAINYYTKNKKIKAVSFNADYINWFNLNHKITDVVLVKNLVYDKDTNRTTERPLFDSVFLAAKRINTFAIEREICIYVLRGAKVDIIKRIKDEMERKKNYR
jgi:hypothetical protein